MPDFEWTRRRIFNAQISEKFRDFFLAHFVGMAFAMKKNEAPDPIYVSLLRTDRIVFYAQLPPDAVE